MRLLRIRLAVTQPIHVGLQADRIYRTFNITVHAIQRTYSTYETYIPTTIRVVWDAQNGVFRSIADLPKVYWDADKDQFTDDMLTQTTPAVEWDTVKEQFQPIVE